MPHLRHLGLLSAALLLTSGLARAQGAPPDSVPVPQRDLMDLLSQIIGIERSGGADTVPSIVLSVLPAFSVNPAFGVLFGVSGNALTRFGPAPETNVSTGYASVSYTTKQQFNIIVRTSIFGSGNRYLLQGDWRYLDSSQPTYGLGPAQPESRKDDLEYRLLRIYQSVYRPLSGKLLAGVGYHLDNYFDIVDPNAEQGLDSPFLEYNGGRTVTRNVSSGLSLNLAFDDRDSPIYPTQGYYAQASFRMFPTWLGSDVGWQSFQTDFRTYGRIGPANRGVVGLWAMSWFTFGPTPYLSLPAIGWDTNARSGRGYPQGRVRGQDQLYLEGEYRVTLSRDGMWGVAGFAGVLATSEPATGNFGPVDPFIGAGLRIKLNKRSTTNITLDFGFGAQGSNGLFMGTGEAF